MPIIRKVYGPFGFEEVGLPGYTTHELRWYFFGVRDDYGTSHWMLIYHVLKRSFSAHSTGGGVTIGGRQGAALTAQNVSRIAGNPIHPRMFIEGDTTPVMEGTVTSILRNRLSNQDIGIAAATSIASIALRR